VAGARADLANGSATPVGGRSQLDLKPTANAAFPIMSAINSLPAGRTPLTQGIETAAEALDFRSRPGVVVVLTDGEETCGRSPCDLGKQLRAQGYKLTVHVIAFRYEGFSWALPQGE
jgi:Ca-activated chloride channel family protein